MPKKTLSVYADPFAALDHEGRPAHACPTDPSHTGTERRWVGACLSAETALHDISRDEKLSFVVAAKLHEHPQTTVFDHDEKAIELPATQYYRARLRDRSLIPADAKTAREVGIEFSDPKARIEASRAKAIVDWYAQHEEFPPFASDDEKKAFADALAKAEAEKAAAEEAAKKAVGAPAKPAPKTTEAPASPARPSATKEG